MFSIYATGDSVILPLLEIAICKDVRSAPFVSMARMPPSENSLVQFP